MNQSQQGRPERTAQRDLSGNLETPTQNLQINRGTDVPLRSHLGFRQITQGWGRFKKSAAANEGK